MTTNTTICTIGVNERQRRNEQRTAALKVAVKNASQSGGVATLEQQLAGQGIDYMGNLAELHDQAAQWVEATNRQQADLVERYHQIGRETSVITGASATSTLRVIQALLECATRAGKKLDGETIDVAVSQRDLQELADIGDRRTVACAIQRLEAAGWLQVESSSNRLHATSYRLTSPDVLVSRLASTNAHTLHHSCISSVDENLSGVGCVQTSRVEQMTHVIWSAKGLSLSAAEVYRELARSGAQRVCDLDRSLRLHRNTIAKRLRVMERVGLVQRSGRYWSVVPIGLDGLDALADDMGLGEWRASLRERNIRERHNWQSNGLGGRRSPEGVTPPRPEARGSRLLAMDPASITSALEQWRTERTEGSQPKAALVGGLGCSLGDYRRAHDPTMLHSPTRAAYMVRRRPAGALVDSDARTGNLAA